MFLPNAVDINYKKRMSSKWLLFLGDYCNIALVELVCCILLSLNYPVLSNTTAFYTYSNWIFIILSFRFYFFFFSSPQWC